MTLQRIVSLLKIKDNYVFKNIKFRKYSSFLSALLRILFRFKFIFRNYYFFKENVNIKSLNDFWMIRIGFNRKRNFLPYLNVDPHILNNPQLCSNLINLPFYSRTCQEIYVKHFFYYFSIKKFNSVIKNWRKLLIPGGILKIQFKHNENIEKIEILKEILKKNRFHISKIEDSDIILDNSLTISAIKERVKPNISQLLKNEKSNDIRSIIRQNENLFFNNKKLCILGISSISLKKYLKKLYLNKIEIQSTDNLSFLREYNDNYFDGIIIANFLEFNNYSTYKMIFNEIRRVLKPKSKILLIIPEKQNYCLRETTTYFNKGRITQILDEENFRIEWLNLNSSFKMIQILIFNQFESPVEKKGTKICLMGNYTLRYTHLNSTWWDGQVRAFEKLGYDLLILDIKDHSFNYLLKSIKLFNPDILWIAGKIVIEFLKENADYFRSSKIKVIYWFWDARIPIKYDFSNLIHTMFISSIGEISLYKKAYNLKRVYFMPAPITPQIMHRNRFIKEKYDIGFSGRLDYSKYHKERTEIINYLKKFFQVKVVNNVYNNIPEFYAQCKIVFGGTPYLRKIELIASNRFYIALSCGTCHLTNYVHGLEKLVTNHKHLIWYDKKEELIPTIHKYLKNAKLRLDIKLNAERLAKEKHNYLIRIRNMLDIVNGETEEYYGYLDRKKILL